MKPNLSWWRRINNRIPMPNIYAGCFSNCHKAIIWSFCIHTLLYSVIIHFYPSRWHTCFLFFLYMSKFMSAVCQLLCLISSCESLALQLSFYQLSMFLHCNSPFAVSLQCNLALKTPHPLPLSFGSGSHWAICDSCDSSRSIVMTCCDDVRTEAIQYLPWVTEAKILRQGEFVMRL